MSVTDVSEDSDNIIISLNIINFTQLKQWVKEDFKCLFNVFLILYQ